MGLPATIEPRPQGSAEVEAAVDQVIATCDGDARAAVHALVVAAGVCEAEMQALQQDIARLTAIVSRGYARGRVAPRGAPRGEA